MHAEDRARVLCGGEGTRHALHARVFGRAKEVILPVAVDTPRGAGLYAWDAELVLTNVVVSNNVTWWGRYSTVSGAGDGIYLRGTSTALLRYTNLWGDHPDNLVVADSPATVSTDAPLSVDPAFEDDALHLSGTSPLIDAGDPAILDPDGSRSDIGAYGGAFAARWDLDGDGWSAWWLPGAYDPATSPDMDCDDGDAAVYPGSGC